MNRNRSGKNYPAKLNFFLEKYRNESRDLHLKVMEHNNNFRSSIKEVIPNASRDVFSCSPDNYVFGNLEDFHLFIYFFIVDM